jgi:hypothetical protein
MTADTYHCLPAAGLSGFALFVTISGMLLSAFMLMVPVVYEKYDKLARLARGLKEIRVGFILSGYGTLFSLLIAYVDSGFAVTMIFNTFTDSL